MLGSIASTGSGAVNSATSGIGSLANGNSAARTAQSAAPDSLALTPWVLVTLVVIYLVWAAVEQHQRIKESIAPSNIALNVRNILAISFTAIIGIVWLKILLTKLTAIGVPGAAAVARIVAAA